MRSAIAVIVGLVATLEPITARADDFADAQRAEVVLDYDRALTLITGILARGGADPARLVELHLAAGRLAAGIGRVAVAEDHFARALALRPSAALAPGTSPKMTAPFAAAAARAIPPLAITPVVDPGLVRVAVDADPLGLAVGIAVETTDAAGEHRTVVARDALHVALPAGATAVAIEVLDDSGNHVWVGVPPAAIVQAPAAAPPPSTPHRALFARWSTWTAIAGLAAVGGGIAAWREHVAQSNYNLEVMQGDHEFSTVEPYELRGRRYAVAADVGFGIAAAAGVTAVVLAITHRREVPVAIAPTIESTGGGASLVLTGHY